MALDQLSDVVQRCQAVSDHNYSTEDYDVFTISGRSCLEEGHSTQVLSIIVDEKNQDMVRCMGWYLLPPLVHILLKKGDNNAPHCLAILKHLLEVCSPKELLIALLEQVESVQPVQPEALADTVLLLLDPLQQVLLRLGSVLKASSLGMALSTLLKQVSKLPVPETKEQEEDDVFSLCRCCSAMTHFIRPFVADARLAARRGRERDGRDGDGTSEDKEDELRTELLKFCMKTLREPLLDVQLKDPDTLPSSPLRDFATDILNTLTDIGESLPNLLFHPLLRRKEVPGFLEEEVRYPKDSLANLAHLLYVHHLAMNHYPAVYSSVYVLRCNMEHVNHLLCRIEESRIQKGLELYEQSLVRMEDDSLTVDLLEIKVFTSVPENLVKVMTLCLAHHLRIRGLKLLQLSIDKFDLEAKYKFFQCMLKISHHSGVEGYIIKNIRNQIDFSLKPGNSNEWFQGSQLLPLLRQVFCLPDGPETDLLHNLDRLMEALTLLRYLVIRDKETDNQTGVWTELYRIQDSFMKPLRVGVNMSRAHYDMELEKTLRSKRTNVKADPLCNRLSVTVGDEKLKLPSMTSDSQIQALNSALNTFDMMESILVRIEELVELKDDH